jgi:hypothetical protein
MVAGCSVTVGVGGRTIIGEAVGVIGSSVGVIVGLSVISDNISGLNVSVFLSHDDSTNRIDNNVSNIRILLVFFIISPNILYYSKLSY